MKIGIIGAGNIGATAARLFVKAGDEIAISNSRGPETLAALVEALGESARATTPAGAADFGDVVLIAVPFKAYIALPAGELRGKITIDATNYYPSRDGHFAQLDAGETTSSELVASHLPGARVVKAFNTIWSEHLRAQAKVSTPLERRRAIFIAGDDAEAKRIVTELIESIGFGAVDTGTLTDSRLQQPGTAPFNSDVTVGEGRRLLQK